MYRSLNNKNEENFSDHRIWVLILGHHSIPVVILYSMSLFEGHTFFNESEGCSGANVFALQNITVLH